MINLSTKGCQLHHVYIMIDTPVFISFIPRQNLPWTDDCRINSSEKKE